ncbi:MAG TPA: hypothetical protein PKH19_03440 [Candidatus Syntrophosphaera sp.]|nr:hypothetical protein [Candidatus Syntrophosphaera sp.]
MMTHSRKLPDYATGRLFRARCIILLLAALICALPLAAQANKPGPRGGIVFEFANSDLVTIDGNRYLSLDVMVSSPDANQRIGTGVVFVNYNPQAFGNSVKTNGNVIVSQGSLIVTSPFPFYNMIINDNSPSRLAVTYEYLFAAGYGSLLTGTPQQLVNLKFRVLNIGFATGFSFQQSLMANQQYIDNNTTLFNPVVASDTENILLPTQPEILYLTIIGDAVQLTWQQINGCVYTVYSTADPLAAAWLIEASELSEPAWNTGFAASRKFYRITATGVD